MTIRKLFVPLLALCILQGACLQEKKEAPRQDEVAVVDLSRIIRDSAPGKAAQDFLNTLQQAYSEKLTAASMKAQANKDDAQLLQALETMYTDLQQRYQQEQQAASNTLMEQIQKTVADVRQKKGYKVVIHSEAVMASEPASDISGLVIEELARTTIEFKPVTGDPAAIELPAPASAETAAPAEAAPAEAPAPAAEAAPAEAPAPAAEAAPAEAPAPAVETAPAETPAK